MNEIERDQLCFQTYQCFSRAGGSMSRLPKLLRLIISERAWERRQHGTIVIELSSLLELVTKKPIYGWGEDPKKIEALLKDEPDVLAMWRKETVRHGGDRKSKESIKRHNMTLDNVPLAKDRGTSKSYTLTRLERDHPELFKRVVAGELSANAAAIEAGFRKKKTPEELVIANFQKCDDQLSVLRQIIGAMDDRPTLLRQVFESLDDWEREALKKFLRFPVARKCRPEK